jgi:hypothetical protein
VNESTRGFTVQVVTLNIGSKEVGYGCSYPENLNEMDQFPDMYTGYLPPLAEESRKKGFSGMSKHAITRHEHREARKKAAATNSADAEATIAADYDAAIADEAIDKSALEAMALVEAEHGTKEAEKDAKVKKKKKLADAKKLLLLKEQLLEHERTGRPRRRATSTAMLESIQNEIPIQGGKSKAKKPKRKAKANKAKRPKGTASSSSGDANKEREKKRAKK